MVDIAEIVDRESLRAWLKIQAKEVSVWIAYRCAMRVLPVWWNRSLQSRDKFAALPTLRCNLISGVACTMPSPKIKRATADAAYAAYTAKAADYAADAAAYAANSAANAADAAAYAANAAAYAAYAADTFAFWQALQKDCKAIVSKENLNTLKLWDAQSDEMSRIWADVKSELAVSVPSRPNESAHGTVAVDWSFWTNWYNDALDGTPPNWDMLERIALIDSKEWDKGAKVVNPLIAKIVAEYEVEPEANLTPQQALNKNAKAVTAQLEALRIFVEEEIQRIRSSNSISVKEREQVNARVIALEGIVETIKKMITALADGDCAPENALVVIEEQLPKVFEAADKLTEQEPEIGATIVAMGEIVEHLTKRGVPGHIATAIAGIDIASRPIRKRIKRNNKTKE